MCVMKQQQTLPLPNPGDWITTKGAAFLLGVSRRTVERLAEKGALTPYRPYGALGEVTPVLFWREQVNEVLTARLMVAGGVR